MTVKIGIETECLEQIVWNLKIARSAIGIVAVKD